MFKFTLKVNDHWNRIYLRIHGVGKAMTERRISEWLGTMNGALAAVVALVGTIGTITASVAGATSKLAVQFGFDERWIWGGTALVYLALAIYMFRSYRSFVKFSRLERPQAFRLDARDSGSLIGRDVDLDQLHSTVQRYRITLMDGESGCGKSALIMAGLVPRLMTENGLMPVSLRNWRDDWEHGPLVAMVDALHQALTEDQRQALGWISSPDLAEDSPILLTVLDNALDVLLQKLGRRVLLITDQFDDYQAQHRSRFLDANGNWITAKELARNNAFWAMVARRLDSGSLHLLAVTRADTASGLVCLRFMAQTRIISRTLPRVDLVFLHPLLEGVAPANAQPPVISNPDNGWNDLRARLEQELRQQGAVLMQQVRTILLGLARLPLLTLSAYRDAGEARGMEVLAIMGALDRAQAVMGGDKAARHAARQLLAMLVLPGDASTQPKALRRTLSELRDCVGPGIDLERLLAELQAADIIRPSEGGDIEASWQLDHDYLARAVLAEQRNANLLFVEMKDGLRHFTQAVGPVDHWRSLLPLWTQLRIWWARWRRRLTFDDALPYLLYSAARSFVQILLILGMASAALLWIRADRAARQAEGIFARLNDTDGAQAAMMTWRAPDNVREVLLEHVTSSHKRLARAYDTHWILAHAGVDPTTVGQAVGTPQTTRRAPQNGSGADPQSGEQMKFMEDEDISFVILGEDVPTVDDAISINLLKRSSSTPHTALILQNLVSYIIEDEEEIYEGYMDFIKDDDFAEKFRVIFKAAQKDKGNSQFIDHEINRLRIRSDREIAESNQPNAIFMATDAVIDACQISGNDICLKSVADSLFEKIEEYSLGSTEKPVDNILTMYTMYIRAVSKITDAPVVGNHLNRIFSIIEKNRILYPVYINMSQYIENMQRKAGDDTTIANHISLIRSIIEMDVEPLGNLEDDTILGQYKEIMSLLKNEDKIKNEISILKKELKNNDMHPAISARYIAMLIDASSRIKDENYIMESLKFSSSRVSYFNSKISKIKNDLIRSGFSIYESPSLWDHNMVIRTNDEKIMKNYLTQISNSIISNDGESKKYRYDNLSNKHFKEVIYRISDKNFIVNIANNAQKSQCNDVIYDRCQALLSIYMNSIISLDDEFYGRSALSIAKKISKESESIYFSDLNDLSRHIIVKYSGIEDINNIVNSLAGGRAGTHSNEDRGSKGENIVQILSDPQPDEVRVLYQNADRKKISADWWRQQLNNTQLYNSVNCSEIDDIHSYSIIVKNYSSFADELHKDSIDDRLSQAYKCLQRGVDDYYSTSWVADFDPNADTKNNDDTVRYKREALALVNQIYGNLLKSQSDMKVVRTLRRRWSETYMGITDRSKVFSTSLLLRSLFLTELRLTPDEKARRQLVNDLLTLTGHPFLLDAGPLLSALEPVAKRSFGHDIGTAVKWWQEQYGQDPGILRPPPLEVVLD